VGLGATAASQGKGIEAAIGTGIKPIAGSEQPLKMPPDPLPDEHEITALELILRHR
jgi:hypothetical protein